MSRTHSKEAHGKVLKAALRLIAERGAEATSMDAIVAESGVSKATVYKHWASKDALLIEMIESLSEKCVDLDTGDAKADLRALLRHLAEGRKREEPGRIWPRVISYAASNPEFAKALRGVTMGPRRAQIGRILDRAAQEGGIRGGIDVDFAMDLLIGPIIHRRLMDQESKPVELADQVVDYFWTVFGKKR